MWINGFWANGFFTSGFWEGDEPVIPPLEGAISPLEVAVQGIGFTPVSVALQGLVAFILDGGKTEDLPGGGAPVEHDRPRRKSRRGLPQWLAQLPVEEEEALVLIGIL